MNNYLKNFLLIFFTVIIALLVVEGLSRLFFDPIDFLKPKTVSDQVLRYKIEPNSGAHDSWGFRNKSVPETADIVAVGDSHTYGISATASNSWPSILQNLSGKQIYNISLGGYGPAEYLYLMKDKALKLNPAIIIVGLYLGNDLKNAFTSVYNIPFWKNLRDPEFQFNHDDNQSVKDTSKYSMGNWLAGHSMIYRIISSSFIGDYLRQRRRINKGEEIIMFSNKESGIRTGFTPAERLKGLDLDNPEVAEGLRLSLGFINQMKEIAWDNNVRLVVLIIPTKESVYAQFIEGNDKFLNSTGIDLLIRNERRANDIIKMYLKEHGIDYIDLLDSLRNASGKAQIYPGNFGGHANKNGYRIFAETIYQHLSANSYYENP